MLYGLQKKFFVKIKISKIFVIGYWIYNIILQESYKLLNTLAHNLSFLFLKCKDSLKIVKYKYDVKIITNS